MRTEKDFIGEVELEDDVLYGIHSHRASENFPDRSPFVFEWYMALGKVKKACYSVAERFYDEVSIKYPRKKFNFRILEKNILKYLILASEEVSIGEYFNHFIVPAISGGAGTSINMNINEIITNTALLKMNKKPGDYKTVDPVEHANIFQSTNDVVPTALKVAVMGLLQELENGINALRQDIEKLEKNHLDTLRIGFTQMQEAVPSSYGRLFSNYNDALSRDWWRVSKCFERIKVVNLGGSAIGTGITAPRFFIMHVVQELQRITGLPVTRGDNLTDNTSNLDSYVEIHATLKAHAVNLEKMVNDIRLLSSDLLTDKEVELPKKQVGSSIMPGKVNPVIPEYVISCCHQVYANDQLISSLSAQGCLDLNAYIPIVGNALLNSLKLLIGCDSTIKENIFKGIIIHTDKALKRLLNSPSITTALVPVIGYNKASELALYMKNEKCDIFEANKKLSVLDNKKLGKMVSVENLLNLGFRLQDIFE